MDLLPAALQVDYNQASAVACAESSGGCGSLEQAHGVGIVHGDIKAENVLLTSWNWV